MNRMALLTPLVLLVLASCGPAETPGATPSAGPLARVDLTDGLGRELVFDTAPARVVIAGRAAQLILHSAFLFEEADTRVVAMEQRTQRGVSMLPLVDSEYDGKMQLERDAAAEAIAAAHPDVVLLKSYLAKSLGAPLEALGLATVYLDLETPEQFFRDIRILGALFGNPGRAEEVLAFYQERLDRVSEVCMGIPAAERPRVLLLQYTDQGGEVALNAPPADWLQTIMVERACGEPVWLDASGGGWTVVDFEQIAAWNADKIFVIYYSGDPVPVVESLRADPGWAALRAVRSDDLYAFPGDYVSWDQPDPRWILGLEWLASRLMPAGLFVFHAETEVQAFYQELYGLNQATVAAEVLPRLNGDLAP
ncbi:MAG: ABC transporter substrate-binding protein [Chloroflexi bacterium]|nr:ABC transporter substrate-binding protein [Chloroflexota bacterium]